MKHYEQIGHTADIAIRAYGDTLEEAFACAAGAMFEIITEHAEIRASNSVDFVVEADDLENLLVEFLSRLVLANEVDGWVFGDFSVTFEGESRLRAVAVGEKFDTSRHGGGLQIKGVSYHMIEITPPVKGAPASVQVLFDI